MILNVKRIGWCNHVFLNIFIWMEEEENVFYFLGFWLRWRILALKIKLPIGENMGVCVIDWERKFLPLVRIFFYFSFFYAAGNLKFRWGEVKGSCGEIWGFFWLFKKGGVGCHGFCTKCQSRKLYLSSRKADVKKIISLGAASNSKRKFKNPVNNSRSKEVR